MRIYQDIFLIPFIIMLLFCCSPTEETQIKKQGTDSVYVFDEIPPEDIFKFESPVPEASDVYIIQVGAFSGLERAKEFAQVSRIVLNKDIKVEYNESKNLYVVWIHPPFRTKSEASNYRKQIISDERYKDAWILTLESKK